MSEETTRPTSEEETSAMEPTPEQPSTLAVAQKKKPSPKWVSASDLGQVVQIMAQADKITPEEVVKRLNTMCEKGKLLIVPSFGARK